MNKSLVFAKRNLKEILRDPLSLIFNFAFPIAMLTIFFCFTWGKHEESIINHTPMFAPNKIIPAIAVFGFSFLTLFVGMLVSKDRSTSFTARLKTTPMKPKDFFIGYALPMLLIAFIQIIVTYFIGWLYSLAFAPSLQFNLWSVNSLISIFINIPIAIFFIACGILLGAIINEKAIGGISSILVNVAAITSGMFMPLYTMGWFKNMCQALPFFHSVSLVQDTSSGVWPESVAFYDDIVKQYASIGIDYNVNILDTWWMHLIFVGIYTVIIVLLSVFIFKKRLQSDNK